MRKIAIPLLGDKFSPHFGGANQFGLYTVDGDKIVRQEILPAPKHEHGAFPAWLARHQVNEVIAGGIGKRAINLFVAYNIEVHCGVEEDTPENLLRKLLKESLTTTDEPCTEHGHHDHNHHHNDHKHNDHDHSDHHH